LSICWCEDRVFSVSGGYLGFGLADNIFGAPLHSRLKLVPIFREPSPSDNIEQLDASEFIAVKGMAELSGQPIWRARLNVKLASYRPSQPDQQR
jgi:hypothetical protein